MRRTLAVLYVLTAAGIGAFWLDWFASGAYANAGDACYRVFENTFPLPDGVMALLLLVAAAGLWRAQDNAARWALLAAGMLLHLFALDFLYHLQHGHFTRWDDPETWTRVFICTHTLALALLTIAWIMRHRLYLLVRRSRLALFLLGLIVFSTLAYWVWRISGAHVTRPECAAEYENAFWLADAITVALAALTAAGLLTRKSWTQAAALPCCGMLLFGTLSLGSFTLLNPELIAGHLLDYLGLLLALSGITAYLTTAFFRQRNE